MSQTIILSAASFWRSYRREAIALGVLGAAAAVALGGVAYSTPTTGGLEFDRAARTAAPPAPPPLLVRQLAPEDALSINRAIPIADLPNPAARPFTLAGADSESRARALECLTSAVYYEAGSESAEGQQAVAQVVLNRVRNPAFPGSVCDVVYQGSTRVTGCQFTFTCDGSLNRQPSVDGWARARKVAAAALAGTVYRPAGNATHYHAAYVVPYWASSLVKNAVVGTHIFYRWAGGWGRPASFTKRYAAREPNVAALRTAALAAEARGGDAADAIAELGGTGLAKSADGRVAIRFSVAARKAVEDAPHREYVEKFEASDNLRWTLNGGMPSDDKPLGGPRPVVAAAAGGSAGAGGGAGAGSPQP